MNLKQNYKQCWEFLNQAKWHIVASLAIFCLFILIGFIFPIFFQQKILIFLQQLAEKFQDLNVYETITSIFWNNLKSSFFAIILGVTIGIFPIATLITNGYLLGFVARFVSMQENTIFVLWKLAPHGIFELPAIILSTGIGLKIGLDIFKKNPGKILKQNYKQAMRFFVFVILPLLLVAAIIEGILLFVLS